MRRNPALSLSRVRVNRQRLMRKGLGTREYRRISRNNRILIKIKRLKTPGDSRQAILIVLPSDIYNALSEGGRNALEKYRLDASHGLH